MVEKTQGVTQEKNSRPYIKRKQSNKKHTNGVFSIKFCGGLCRTRTHDQSVMSAPL